jgi:ABC-type lipoprotein release transport system permease subunit
VLVRARAAVRRGWVAHLVVALLVAFGTAAALTLGAGARRTASAPDAYTAFVGGDHDALLEQHGGLPKTAQVAALPGVESVAAMTFVFAGIDSDREPETESITFAGTLPYGSRLVAGRLPDPTRAHEFIADETFAAERDAEVGERFPFVTLTEEQAYRGAFFEEPRGPSFEGELVGIIRSASVLESEFSIAVFPTALLDEDIPFVATIMSVHLAPGGSVEALRAGLDSLPDGREISVDGVERAPVISSEIRQAVDAQAQGIALMALVAALVAVVALGQLLTRHSRLSAVDRETLSSLGATRVQIAAESLVRAAVPAMLGVGVGVVVAIVASGRFPTGFVRRLEPTLGIRIDATVLAFGALGLLVLLLVWVGIALYADRSTRKERSAPAAAEALTRRAPNAAAAVGMRFAVTGREGSTRSTRGTLLAGAFIVAGLVGSAAFAVSLERLVTDPSRSGMDYSFAVGAEVGYTADELRTRLRDDPEIESLTVLTGSIARAGDATIELIAVDQVTGGLAPPVLSGRRPAGAGEIAFGRVTARLLGVGIGDTIELAGDAGTRSYLVVGNVVVPGVAGNDGVGNGAVVTEAGLGAVQRDATEGSLAAIKLRPDASPDAGERIGTMMDTEVDLKDTWSKPSSISNVGRVRGIPSVLAVLLAVLVMLTMAHAVIMSLRGRRHEMAVLRVFGADRRWVAGAVHWQASTITALPLLIGIPLGLVVGALVFRAFVDRIGAVPDPVLPVLLVVGIAAALLVIANLVAIIPARLARRVSTAEQLRVE